MDRQLAVLGGSGAVVVYCAGEPSSDLCLSGACWRTVGSYIIEHPDQHALPMPIVGQARVKPVERWAKIGLFRGFANAVESMANNTSGKTLQGGIFDAIAGTRPFQVPPAQFSGSLQSNLIGAGCREQRTILLHSEPARHFLISAKTVFARLLQFEPLDEEPVLWT